MRVGEIAQQANGSAWVQLGQTIVLATAVIDRKILENLDFLPLTVNYFERAYAANKIPGSYNRREGKPQDHEARMARLIDRALRPMLPDGLAQDVQVVITVLSYDPEVGTESASFLAAFLALWQTGLAMTPTAGLFLGLSGEETFLPFAHNTDMDLFIALDPKGVLMLEGSFKEIPHATLLKACHHARELCAPLWSFLEAFQPEHPFSPHLQPIDLSPILPYEKELTEALFIADKKSRRTAIREIRHKVDMDELSFYHMLKRTLSKAILDGRKRIDGRKLEELRPISVEMSILPNAHSSVLVTKGETQVLTVLTVGGVEDRQYIDDLNAKHSERCIVHYTFMPFCVGETDVIGSPSRREIGHGHIVWRALHRLIPKEPDYTYRLVNEVLSSNGSSSMLSVCASSLALVRGGINLREHVAGVAIGYLSQDGQGVFLADLSGDEDMEGLMDFKIAGTRNGITALQMDIKMNTLAFDLLDQAFDLGRRSLDQLLDHMHEVAKPKTYPLHASIPKRTVIDIGRDKIRLLIGKGGKTIEHISQECEAKIDVNDAGRVVISAESWKNIYMCKKIIRSTIQEPEKGVMYDGVVIGMEDGEVLIRFHRFLKGMLKFDNHKERDHAWQELQVGKAVRVYFDGCDRYGDITLRWPQE